MATVDDCLDLTSAETGALIKELQERGAEGVNLAPFCEDEDLIAECAKRGIRTYDPDEDGPFLKDAGSDEVIERAEELDCLGLFIDDRDRDRLIEFIIEGRTDDALDTIWQFAPGGVHPAAMKRLVADRIGAALKEMLA